MIETVPYDPIAIPERKGKHFEDFEDDYIRNHYLVDDARTIARVLGRSKTGIENRCRKLGCLLPLEIKQKRNMYFPKGHVPLNKGKRQSEYMSKDAIEKTIPTRFKKGQAAINELKDGAITIRRDTSKDGTVRDYKWKRISKGNWKMLHVYNWEQLHGPVPEGMIIVFKNKLDTMNCEVRNLECISKVDNMLRNSLHNLPTGIKNIIHNAIGLAKSIHSNSATGNKDLAPIKKERRRLMTEAKRLKQRVAKKEERNLKIINRQLVDRARIRAEREKPLYVNKIIDYSQLIKVQIDRKTIVYAKPGQDIQAIRNKYSKSVAT